MVHIATRQIHQSSHVFLNIHTFENASPHPADNIEHVQAFVLPTACLDNRTCCGNAGLFHILAYETCRCELYDQTYCVTSCWVVN